MNLNPVIWWEIASDDGARLAGFLRDVLDWQLQFDGNRVYDLPASHEPGASIGGCVFTINHANPNHVQPHLTI